MANPAAKLPKHGERYTLTPDSPMPMPASTHVWISDIAPGDEWKIVSTTTFTKE